MDINLVETISTTRWKISKNSLMCAKNFDHMTFNARDRNAGRGGLRVVYPADRDLEKPWRHGNRRALLSFNLRILDTLTRSFPPLLLHLQSLAKPPASVVTAFPHTDHLGQPNHFREKPKCPGSVLFEARQLGAANFHSQIVPQAYPDPSWSLRPVQHPAKCLELRPCLPVGRSRAREMRCV